MIVWRHSDGDLSVPVGEMAGADFFDGLQKIGPSSSFWENWIQAIERGTVEERDYEPHRRLTGQEIFDAKSPREQDEMLGPEAAELVRIGQLSVEDLKATSQNEAIPDFITQRPLKDVT